MAAHPLFSEPERTFPDVCWFGTPRWPLLVLCLAVILFRTARRVHHATGPVKGQRENSRAIYSERVRETRPKRAAEKTAAEILQTVPRIFGHPGRNGKSFNNSILAWRRGRDSNPRYGCPYAAFRVRCFQPLSHPSGDRCVAPFGAPCLAKRGRWHKGVELHAIRPARESGSVRPAAMRRFGACRPRGLRGTNSAECDNRPPPRTPSMPQPLPSPPSRPGFSW